MKLEINAYKLANGKVRVEVFAIRNGGERWSGHFQVEDQKHAAAELGAKVYTMLYHADLTTEDPDPWDAVQPMKVGDEFLLNGKKQVVTEVGP